MATQFEILPLVVVEYKAFNNKVGRGRAVAENGLTYIVKSDNGDRPICATEWICTAIAEALHLPVAQSKILKMRDGRLVFGSELLSNRMPEHELGAFLLKGIRPNGLSVPGLTSILSQIYTLDLVLGNHDRHADNFLMSLEWSDDRSTRTGNLRPFDFESANIVTRAASKLPLVSTSQTLTTARSIRKVHGFDAKPATYMLTQFAKAREFIVEGATRGLPDQWLSATDRTALLDRVRSDSFEQEIHEIERGLVSGSYL